MPMHPVTVRRWEVLISFVILTIVYVISLAWTSHVSSDNKRNERNIARIQSEHDTTDAMKFRLMCAALHQLQEKDGLPLSDC